jgi:hypothetical protein
MNQSLPPSNIAARGLDGRGKRLRPAGLEYFAVGPAGYAEMSDRTRTTSRRDYLALTWCNVVLIHRTNQ